MFCQVARLMTAVIHCSIFEHLGCMTTQGSVDILFRKPDLRQPHELDSNPDYSTRSHDWNIYFERFKANHTCPQCRVLPNEERRDGFDEMQLHENRNIICHRLPEHRDKKVNRPNGVKKSDRQEDKKVPTTILYIWPDYKNARAALVYKGWRALFDFGDGAPTRAQQNW